MNFHQLEDRNLLAAITVNNATDLVSPTADTSSITALIANDGGDGISIREAIVASNNTLGEDTIVFDGSVFTGGGNSLIRLTQGELDVTETLTIDASMATEVLITGDADGNDVTVPGTHITDVVASFGGYSGATNALLEDNSRVINFTNANVNGGGSLTLFDLTLTGGRGRTGYVGGGGVLSGLGDVSLNNSNVTGNIAYGSNGNGGNGGGIATLSGNVSLTKSSVNGNRTSIGSGFGGGGIFTREGDVSLTDSDVSGNSTIELVSLPVRRGYGGGILALFGSVSLLNSAVFGNNSFGAGGGILGGVNVSVTLTNSTVSENSTLSPVGDGGGIFAQGNVFITDSTVSGNSTSGRHADGGGLFASNGNVLLLNSTVSGNSTTGNNSRGGGISIERGSISVFNSTVTGNSATGDGSSGGGISLPRVLAADDRHTIINSIVTGNVDDGTAPDFLGLQGAEVVVEHSLIGDTTGSGITVSTGSRNILNQPALLGPLADNGGPTLTHALLAGSPAIDAGSDTLAVDADGMPLTTDQRGTGFDRIKFGRVDIGAFESDFDAVPIAPSVLSATINEGGVLARPDLWSTLSVVFDSGVTVSSQDLLLFDDSNGGGAVDLSGVGFSYDFSTNTATWDFGLLANPLDAAFYTYQLDASSITYEGLALDGNGDGMGGDNFTGQHYVALLGDANLDGVVDVLNDAFGLVANLGSTTNVAWVDGNFNGDGIVDVLGDAFVLVANLGQDVRPTIASNQSASVSSRALAEASLVNLSAAIVDDDDLEPAAVVVVAEPPTLTLAGANKLRDDVFGNDF